jgi:hypothetical protein
MPRLILLASLAVAVTISAQEGRTPATKAQSTTKVPPSTPVTKVPPGGTKTAGPARPGITVAPDSAARPQVPIVMREIYDYEAGGRRDPFVSLLMSPELRPTVADLRLVGVLYDESGRRPVAIMRDIQTNTQYRVTTGMSLGRLRVALIKRRSVIFNIEEFGLNRQDSLILGDTTKVRAR